MIDELVLKHFSKLNDTDKYIWNFVSTHRDLCATSSINEIAALCNTSRTTLMRFAQKISLDGFSEFKALLRIEAKNGTSLEQVDLVDKISLQHQQVFEQLAKRDLTKICQLMHQSTRLIGYGTGMIQKNSILEFKRLLLSSGILLFDYDGAAEFEYIAQNSQPGDVLFIVSLSGESNHLVKYLPVLNIKRIPIVSITQFQSNTLASYSTENIFVDTQEIALYGTGKGNYISMTIYYTVIEVLFLSYQNYLNNI